MGKRYAPTRPYSLLDYLQATADTPPATTPEAAELAEASAAPTATGVQVSVEAPAVDTTQLTRDSNATTVTVGN